MAAISSLKFCILRLTEAMFEARVVSIGEDMEAVAILANFLQPLELQCVHEAHDVGGESHFTMHPEIEGERGQFLKCLKSIRLIMRGSVLTSH